MHTDSICKFFRTILIILFSSIVFSALSVVHIDLAQAKEWTKIRFGTDPTAPPAEFLLPDGTMVGFDVDLAADVCARMRVECEWVRQDFDGFIPALNEGKFDVFFNSLLITEKRRQVIDFATPFSVVRQGFLAQNQGPLEQVPASDAVITLPDPNAAQCSLGDLTNVLQGKSLGTDAGTPRVDIAKQCLPETKLNLYPNWPKALEDLVAGRIDALMAPRSFINDSLDGPHGAKLKHIGPWFNGGLLGVHSSVALRKTDPDLKAMLDSAIKSALADGTVRKLSLKWYKLDITPPL